MNDLFNVFDFEADTVDADIEALVQRRQALRAAGDYASADDIRAELTARAVTIEDTADGVRWYLDKEKARVPGAR